MQWKGRRQSTNVVDLRGDNNVSRRLEKFEESRRQISVLLRRSQAGNGVFKCPTLNSVKKEIGEVGADSASKKTQEVVDRIKALKDKPVNIVAANNGHTDACGGAFGAAQILVNSTGSEVQQAQKIFQRDVQDSLNKADRTASFLANGSSETKQSPECRQAYDSVAKVLQNYSANGDMLRRQLTSLDQQLKQQGNSLTKAQKSCLDATTPNLPAGQK